jgi:hypothetical protein
MNRWTIFAALGLAAMTGIGAPSAARASSDTWYQTYQTDTPGNFTEIAATSQNDIWAVGLSYTKAGNLIYRPFIRHFNGHLWQVISIPDSSSFVSTDVSASAANNVWVSGQVHSSTATTAVYRWNGTHWARIPVPATTELAGITALAPNNVWAYVASGPRSFETAHWTGSTWKYFLTPSNFFPQDISASGPGNVWLAGYSFSGKKQVLVAYRWSGTAWDRVNMPHPVIGNGGEGVTAVSPSNVWIGWSDSTTSYALHWNGHQWDTVAIPNPADSGNIVPDGTGGYWFGAQEILTGTTWTTMEVPAFAGASGLVTRIPGTTSFLMPAGVVIHGSIEPTVFRFDL